MHRENFTPTGWSHEQLVLVGKHMLELIAEHTQLISTFMGERMHRVSLSPGVWDIMQRNSYLELLEPRVLPCVVPPKPWDKDCKGGGYWTVSRCLSDLVKVGL
jgi:DNA-directed RNA polymerase